MKTTDGDECFYLSVKKQTMSDVLIKIFSSSWRYSIRTIENIPNQIKDLMLNLEVDIRKVFTMCNTTDDNLHQVPSFLPKVVAVNRMIHHKNLKNNLWQDENDNSSKRLAILQKEEKEENSSSESEDEKEKEDESGFESSSSSMSSIDVDFKIKRKRYIENEIENTRKSKRRI